MTHEPLMDSVVQDVGSLPNAATYAFQSISALPLFFNFSEAMEKPFQLKSGIPYEHPSLEGCFTFEVMNFMAYQYEFSRHKAGDIYMQSD